ncbi:uncharacterized protein LOC129745934 [Uranotaenia lowii]|uniref:uncharacterized protein LOC129745934 n=1 Tax=Uranotaenia lowii TaxID=190385 RepID=UPI00247A4F7C|nr:uncharacterized protein LOC129745934 [Uranotaenia lowii]XP_055595304.1 uncharacterized protein LOC129745934 [Uranotaenia lowii]XP_055595305.1 uncharacterized protein LOC129745934 [Uranotaenia lowii]XP_055595306.1 uncharacterized protein LOC129745934 [Uranotaenia lowii]XP_055595307.1 uncharacterized protein LOC129745934 [Uranotaenia lowii]XP_055595308.1 uncharacterized protein LOC129745934 [Uranotaenia lowii]
MCRCCQSCWEDFYWSCIEERFCYDETIANYDPDEDEYVIRKKAANGFYNSEESMENNNAPICRQPASVARNMSMSSKVHEDDLRREIQTNVPMLAPEVLAVFANSQIFQEQSPPKSSAKSPPIVKFAISPDTSPIEITPPTLVVSAVSNDSLNVSLDSIGGSGGGFSRRENDSDKLLRRLEGSSQDIRELRYGSSLIPRIVEEEQDIDDEVILRPPRNLSEAASFSGSSSIINKNISLLKAEQPYFSTRPASENDIFTISSSSNYNAISMTPEVPSISYSNLPKNYMETPTVEKYRESVSLYSIQTAGTAKEDYSMPRYYRKSDMIVHSADRGSRKLNDAELAAISSGSISNTPSKQHVEKSKRLKNIRMALPPLNLTLVRGHSSSNLKEKEREAREREKVKSKDSIRL